MFQTLCMSTDALQTVYTPSDTLQMVYTPPDAFWTRCKSSGAFQMVYMSFEHIADDIHVV